MIDEDQNKNRMVKALETIILIVKQHGMISE
jgi:hypothetical protein